MNIRIIFKALFVSLATVAHVAPVQGQGLAGSYLAARHATIFSDYEEASKYFARAIISDPSNPRLLENAVQAYLSLGDGAKAATVARRLVSLGAQSQVANMALAADGFRRENYEQLLSDIEAGMSIGPLLDGLLSAWAELGVGRVPEAMAKFDAVATTSGVEVFGLYHKAMALALVGDFEGAEAIMSGESDGALQLTRRGIRAYAQILSQLERNADAVELIDAAFGADLDPGMQILRQALMDEKSVPFDALRSVTDGASEVFLVVAGALNGEANDGYTLLYSRVSEILRPDSTDAILLSAGLLEALERYKLANDAYDKIAPDHPAYVMASLGRADALRKAGDTDASIEVLQQLAVTDPNNAEVHMTLGDILRRLERYDEATAAYDAGIALLNDPGRGQWMAFFTRGITHEREKRWDEAEADFRFALELNPGQPQVLNYLGYSFVEMGINLDEALEMIEQAVAAEPNSGYIVDSLGWVQFRLGQYQDAVRNLERATELLAVDPIINDHLGDAYWAVGRQLEAEFQWRRALSFDPTEEEADRIRRKLEVGLDVVREEAGEPPLQTNPQDG